MTQFFGFPVSGSPFGPVFPHPDTFRPSVRTNGAAVFICGMSPSGHLRKSAPAPRTSAPRGTPDAIGLEADIRARQSRAWSGDSPLCNPDPIRQPRRRSRLPCRHTTRRRSSPRGRRLFVPADPPRPLATVGGDSQSRNPDPLRQRRRRFSLAVATTTRRRSSQWGRRLFVPVRCRGRISGAGG